MQLYLVYFLLSLSPLSVIIEDLKLSCVYADVDKQKNTHTQTHSHTRIQTERELCNQRRTQSTHTRAFTLIKFEGEADPQFITIFFCRIDTFEINNDRLNL